MPKDDNPQIGNREQQNGNNPPPQGGRTDEPQRPAWLPENFKSPEELANSYKELEKWKGQVSPQIELAKKWEQWGDPDTFEGRVQGYIDKQVAERESALARGDKRGAQQAQDKIDQATIEFENLSAGDVTKLTQLLTPQLEKYLESKVNGYWQQAQGQLGLVNQQQDLLIKAMDLKLQNPELDLNQIWGAMAEIAKGDSSTLMRKAVESVLAPKKQEQAIKDAVAAERAKWEQDQKNKDMAVLNGSNTLSAHLKASEGRPKGKDAIKNSVLGKFLQEGKITADQL